MMQSRVAVSLNFNITESNNETVIRSVKIVQSMVAVFLVFNVMQGNSCSLSIRSHNAKWVSVFLTVYVMKVIVAVSLSFNNAK